MRYETVQNYYVDLYPKYLTKHGIIHVNQSYQDQIDQQNLIDLRILAANGSDLAGTYTRIVNGESVSGLPYFNIEQHEIDINRSHNREALLTKYKNYKNLIESFADAFDDKSFEMLSFHGYLKKHSHIDVGILTKRVENQKTLVTLLNPKHFSDKFGISVINIFEEFDFKNLRVNLKVVLETKSELSENELLELSTKIDEEMSDGWGENYNVEEVDEFHDVTGWQFGNKPDEPIIKSSHKLYYPANYDFEGE